MRSKALLALLLGSPAVARACPVCFGQSAGQEGLVLGLTWGIFVLLAATFASIAGLGLAVWKIEKSRELAESTPT